MNQGIGIVANNRQAFAENILTRVGFPKQLAYAQEYTVRPLIKDAMKDESTAVVQFIDQCKHSFQEVFTQQTLPQLKGH